MCVLAVPVFDCCPAVCTVHCGLQRTSWQWHPADSDITAQIPDKMIPKQVVTFEDGRQTNNKASCALPPSDLDSPAAALMSPSWSGHYHFRPCHVCSHIFYKADYGNVLWDMYQSQKHLTLQHVLQTLWRREWLLVFSATTIFSQADWVPTGSGIICAGITSAQGPRPWTRTRGSWSVWLHKRNKIQPERRKVEVRGVQSSRDANVTCWGGGTMANSYTL